MRRCGITGQRDMTFRFFSTSTGLTSPKLFCKSMDPSRQCHRFSRLSHIGNLTNAQSAPPVAAGLGRLKSCPRILSRVSPMQGVAKFASTLRTFESWTGLVATRWIRPLAFEHAVHGPENSAQLDDSINRTSSFRTAPFDRHLRAHGPSGIWYTATFFAAQTVSSTLLPVPQALPGYLAALTWRASANI